MLTALGVIIMLLGAIIEALDLSVGAIASLIVVFVFIEMMRRKPINREVEAYIHGFGLLLLLGFVVVVDIMQFVL